MLETRTYPDVDHERLCPYCRFKVVPGTGAVSCHACGALHHAECWDDNGGCAVMACAGAPLLATVPSVALADLPEGTPAPTRARSVDQLDTHTATRRNRRRVALLVFAVASAALVTYVLLRYGAPS